MGLNEEMQKAHKEEHYAVLHEEAVELLPKLSDKFNREAKAVAQVLMNSSAETDIKAFVHDRDILQAYDLNREYGINPAPLFNINVASSRVRHRVIDIFENKDPDIREYFDAFISQIQQIRRRKLLGRNTESKLAFLKNISHHSFAELLREKGRIGTEVHVAFRSIQDKAIELLLKQKNRISSENKREEIQNVIDQINVEIFFHKLHHLAAIHPYCEWDLEEFFRIYSDEIMQIIGDYSNVSKKIGTDSILNDISFTSNKGIEVSYAKLDKSFIGLGDDYGDCTAQEVRSQVDPEIANIGWTVFPWVLDPYYRVLLTTIDGEKALKGHITPLIIQDRTVLALDAIEAVPKMRDTVKGQPNKFIADRLFKRRKEALDALLEKTKEIGIRMGVEQIHVEKFSNAVWIQEELNNLPPKFYHVDEIHKPFETSAVKKVISDILRFEPAGVNEEVQARNLALWSQGLREGYKEVGLLLGDDWGSKGILSGP